MFDLNAPFNAKKTVEDEHLNGLSLVAVGFTREEVCNSICALDGGIYLILDNAIAKAILAGEDLLQPLLEEGRPYGHSVGMTESKDEQAYIIGIFDDGHPDPEDNGFTLWILMKERWSAEDVCRLLDNLRNITKSTDPARQNEGGTERIFTIPKNQCLN